MRRVYLFMMVSLDGYFEGEDHDLSWHNVDGEFNDFAHEQLRETGALLFGKRTYDLMAGFWPTPQGQADDKEIAATMSALPKVVVSNRPVRPSWQPTKVVTANVHEEITKLKLESGKSIAILGSNALCVSLMEAALVDEFRLMVNPVAIGKGTPLFAGLAKRVKLNFVGSRAFKNGNVLNRYSN
jgi:dihydrofolate reductase